MSSAHQRATHIVGAVIPCLFFGLWWLALAPLAYWLVRRTLALLPTSASVMHQRAREAEALFFLSAFNGCLKSGLPLLGALTTVAALLSTSLKVDLERIYSLLILGAEPIQAWAVLKDDPDLAPLARAIPASHVEGRSLAVVVERVSTLCYENSVKRSRERVKSLSVKLALPVGLCFLPSFLVGGIGPIVYSFFTSLNLF